MIKIGDLVYSHYNLINLFNRRVSSDIQKKELFLICNINDTHFCSYQIEILYNGKMCKIDISKDSLNILTIVQEAK